MGISQVASAALVFLTGLLPASCHKEAAQHKPATPAVAANRSTNAVDLTKTFDRNIGEIALTNLDDTYVQFSTGESFTLTPRILDKNNVRITLAVECRDSYGDTHDFAVTQVIAQPGKPLDVAVGSYNLSFTPQVTTGD